MKILYIEDELSKNIPRILRLFPKYLKTEQIEALNALESDEIGYGAGPEEIKSIVEESGVLEIEYRFPDALRKIIHQSEAYTFFIVDRNISKNEYTHKNVQDIDSNYSEKLYKRYSEREGDYLFLKLALFSHIDVMMRFFFLTAYPAPTELRSAKEIEQLIDLGKFQERNFFEKGNGSEIERLRQIMDTTEIEDLYHETLIQQGESNTLEFKSTLRYCLKQRSAQKYIEHAIMKTIAAYLNSEGGTLLIGVDDNGEILGLENDFSTLAKENKSDEFLKYLGNLIADNFGNRFHRYLDVSLPLIKGKTICAIVVKGKASEDVWLKEKGKDVEQFYIRRLASTVALSPREAVKYIKEHWS